MFNAYYGPHHHRHHHHHPHRRGLQAPRVQVNCLWALQCGRRYTRHKATNEELLRAEVRRGSGYITTLVTVAHNMPIYYDVLGI